jgi:hypothetical protein
MLFVDTESVDLNVVFFNITGTNLSLTFFEPVNQESCDCGVFRDVDNVRCFGVLILHACTEDSETCLFEGFISAFFEFFLFLSFFFELLFDFLFGFHHLSHFGNLIFEEEHFVLVFDLNDLHVVHVNCLWSLLDDLLVF